MIYSVYVKDYTTNQITIGDIFTSLPSAERWIEEQQIIWQDSRDYLIREDGDS